LVAAPWPLYTFMINYKEQTVIITGGTRGIGRAVAEEFLIAGATVVVTYYSDEQAALQFKNHNASCKKRLDVQKFDVSDYVQVENFFKYFEERYGTLQVLVNNSGIRRDSALAMMKQEDWSRVIEINLTGAFNMCKFAVLLMMANRYGRIINITSPSGKHGFMGQTNYAASKAGQVGFSRSLSKEVATRGITVNCLSPGFIDTGFIDDLPEKLRKSYLKDIPLNRFGRPEEVAMGVLFLASKKAGYITGSTLEITGGL